MVITHFDLEVNYIPGLLNIVADALSRIRGADHPTDAFIVASITTGAKAYQLEELCLVVPDGAKKAALCIAHCLLMTGHRGAQVTLERLQKFAFWPKMSKDVKAFVKNCKICITCKSSYDLPASLRPFSDVTSPFERVDVDLVIGSDLHTYRNW
ncbi:uncharacterized protein LOC143025664 [Oratosquilla oratoria]|uniref:uncharacterized protein LOC143025664 n=1 Tax=Oratosquilla oratoria TaxID=337810 RepID=UPI003F772B3B